MKNNLNIVGAKRSDGTDREKNDYYATDPRAIKDLAQFVDIKGDVWENACGEGNLSKEIKKLDGVSFVFSSDLIDRGYGVQIDFMQGVQNAKYDWIITNPPYKFGKDWVIKSLKSADNVAVLMKLVFLESANRHEFFKQSGLKQVLVYSKRLGVYKNNIKTKNSGLIAYAWFIFDKNYKGKANIDWIL